MLGQRPFCNSDAVHAAADSAWIDLREQDYLEAFSGHPKIGDIQSLQKKYPDSAHLARSEQSGVEFASPEILQNSQQLIMLTRRNLDLFLLSVPQEKARLKCWRYFKIASIESGRQS